MELESVTFFKIIVMIFFILHYQPLFNFLLYLLVCYGGCKTLLYLRAFSRFPPLFEFFEIVLLKPKKARLSKSSIRIFFPLDSIVDFFRWHCFSGSITVPGFYGDCDLGRSPIILYENLKSRVRKSRYNNDP